ncbi:MAG: PEP-utilizing enzyme [Candidatus Parcubacteria bacterium]|nr:PEP-utilizing enzyme [Candidatus Parcubacteria bacterium]
MPADWIIIDKFVDKKYLEEMHTSTETHIIIKDYRIPWPVKTGQQVLPPKGSAYLQEYVEYLKKYLEIEMKAVSKKEFYEFLSLSEKVNLDGNTSFLQTSPFYHAKKLKHDLEDARESKAYNKYQTLLKLRDRLVLYALYMKNKEILNELDKLQQERNKKCKKVLAGSAVNELNANGQARLLFNYEIGLPIDIKSYEIIIMQSTNTALLPAMLKAKGIITEMGGALSHASVICREFRIPCLVGVEDALFTFENGDKIEIDSNNNLVRLIKPWSLNYKHNIK